MIGPHAAVFVRSPAGGIGAAVRPKYRPRVIVACITAISNTHRLLGDQRAARHHRNRCHPSCFAVSADTTRQHHRHSAILRWWSAQRIATATAISTVRSGGSTGRLYARLGGHDRLIGGRQNGDLRLHGPHDTSVALLPVSAAHLDDPCCCADDTQRPGGHRKPIRDGIAPRASTAGAARAVVWHNGTRVSRRTRAHTRCRCCATDANAPARHSRWPPALLPAAPARAPLQCRLVPLLRYLLQYPLTVELAPQRAGAARAWSPSRVRSAAWHCRSWRAPTAPTRSDPAPSLCRDRIGPSDSLPVHWAA